jgi:AcrR family transcriptional regulator
MMGAMSDEQVMRKQPKQARSQKRVDQILDAAADLFAEVGYETATTNAIAARAGVAIGTLYQFFPNKDAIMDALMLRYIEGMREVMAFDLSQSITETVHQFVERFAEFQGQHAGFAPIFLTPGRTTLIHEEVVQRVDDALAAYFPTFEPIQRNRNARVLVAIVKVMMPLAGAPDHLPPAEVIAQVKTVLDAYIAAVFMGNKIG